MSHLAVWEAVNPLTFADLRLSLQTIRDDQRGFVNKNVEPRRNKRCIKGETMTSAESLDWKSLH